ncbi:hypothetical protein HPB50_016908 [Hyalomma asiaticum]|uniref:Uncharacterized protein n=1 Tax=Hyalomma asiaticum TaxID=266040 RepID=A0ACB7TM11_HYAAI|nr:hypothetical protein HPB50_016908 [Hyalomma asiaticum]
MAERSLADEHDLTDDVMQEDEVHLGEDADQHVALSDDIAKSILESEEWPSYVERLRQAGDDDEHIEGLLPAERSGRHYLLWNADQSILDNVDPSFPVGCLDGQADLPSPRLTEDIRLPTPLNDNLPVDDESPTNPLMPQQGSRGSATDCRQPTSFMTDHYSKSSSRPVYLSSAFENSKKLDIIEENRVSHERKQSSSKPLGTPGTSALRLQSGRSGSRNAEYISGARASKNSADWSPDIEQLRASLIGSGSSGEGDLFKSSFRISKSGSSIVALERLFREVIDASAENQACLAEIQEDRDVRCSPTPAAAGADVNDLRRAAMVSSTATKGLPLQRLGRGAFGRVFGVQIKGRLVAVKDVRNVDAPSERNASQLIHRHVVRTLCVAQLEPRRFLVVMEYGGPRNLQHLLDERGPLGTLDVCRFGRQLASALHYCHRNNVLHLDVKPSNVLVHNGDSKLADFGSSATRGSHPKVVRLRVRPRFAENNDAAELRDLVNRCWSHEPEQRPSVGAVLLELNALHKVALKSRFVQE